ncbi:hypothetical protein [Mesorhizobium australafricanum]|uniref:Transposase n=1 Tax=Mesorhizobium australafricanum TaxID=3072311 RepID=A0ABU4X1R5_9HYPH|nr:hypothetical protein [Mesorhizobium sp. VK3E]MDX8442257.1 hypothetical protein [Mesorhizobium sp. VK3E]
MIRNRVGGHDARKQKRRPEGRRLREAMIPNPVEAARDHPVMKSLANR